MDKEVVIVDGGQPAEKRINPQLMQFILLDDIACDLAEMNRQSRRQNFLGKPDSLTLQASGRWQVEILTDDPWITVSFFNRGPDTVAFSINNTTENELQKDESHTIDFAGSEERIEQILYRCPGGGAAVLEARGKY